MTSIYGQATWNTCGSLVAIESQLSNTNYYVLMTCPHIPHVIPTVVCELQPLMLSSTPEKTAHTDSEEGLLSPCSSVEQSMWVKTAEGVGLGRRICIRW